MRFTPRKHKRHFRRLELTAMIDVIFLLLIYFLVSTTYTPPESQLEPALQAEKVNAGSAADFEPQVVEVVLVEGTPAFRIGQRVLRTKDELRAVLEQLPREGGVFVKGSNLVATEWATAALQAAYDAGFIRRTYVPMD